MGEAKRKRASGLVVVMESEDFQFRGGFIARIAGYGVPPEPQQHVTDLFYEYVAFARSLGEALGPEHDTRRRAGLSRSRACGRRRGLRLRPDESLCRAE